MQTTRLYYHMEEILPMAQVAIFKEDIRSSAKDLAVVVLFWTKTSQRLIIFTI